MEQVSQIHKIQLHHLIKQSLHRLRQEQEDSSIATMLTVASIQVHRKLKELREKMNLFPSKILKKTS